MSKSDGLGLVERARALQPLIAREAGEIEQTRADFDANGDGRVVENELYEVHCCAASARPGLHRLADAGGNPGRRLDDVVPRSTSGLRHDRGLSRAGCGQRNLPARR